MDVNLIGKLGTGEVENAINKKTELAIRTGLTNDPAQRKQVAQEFAAFLYLEVLKAMRAALPKDGLFEEDSNARDIYTSMMDGEIARAMAKRDTTGLTKMVEKALEKTPGKNESKDKVEPSSLGKVSSGYGLRQDPIAGSIKFHDGVDIATPIGTPIVAPLGGKVTFSGKTAGYGNMVEIEHDDGLVTRYAHNSMNLVAAGDHVEAGQSIALIGNTGRSTGAHLHFEVRKGGKSMDPNFLEDNLTKGKQHTIG
jgi:murein DD-endopeptidase MepM/ murein hydrolase activator NlpD